MQTIYWILIILVAFIGFIILLSFFQAKKASVKLNEEEFKNSMRKGQLVDVRPKQEFQSGHINGARNINMQMIMRSFHQLRKDQPIYLYCNTGRKSSKAAIFLRTKGYYELYELDKGLKNWNGPLK